MTPQEPTQPHHPVETVLYEPDQQRVLAVLPGAIWLSPGDVVELDAPPRDARVLSSRLQLRDGEARVLVVLDVPDDPDDALRGDEPTEVALAVELDAPDPGLSAELDRDLATIGSDLDPAPDERTAQP